MVMRQRSDKRRSFAAASGSRRAYASAVQVTLPPTFDTAYGVQYSVQNMSTVFTSRA